MCLACILNLTGSLSDTLQGMSKPAFSQMRSEVRTTDQQEPGSEFTLPTMMRNNFGNNVFLLYIKSERRNTNGQYVVKILPDVLTTGSEWMRQMFPSNKDKTLKAKIRVRSICKKQTKTSNR